MAVPDAQNPTSAKTSPLVKTVAILVAIFVVGLLIRTCFGELP